MSKKNGSSANLFCLHMNINMNPHDGPLILSFFYVIQENCYLTGQVVKGHLNIPPKVLCSFDLLGANAFL